MSERTWTVAKAEANLSEVIDLALSSGPQTITRNGREVAVIVAAAESGRKMKRVGSLAEFFAASPLRGSQLAIRRLKNRHNQVDL